jgi:hypothetical protein
MEKGSGINLRENVWKKRSLFMFDNNVDALIEFFREVIEGHQNKIAEQKSNKNVLLAPIHQRAVADKTYHSLPKPL